MRHGNIITRMRDFDLRTEPNPEYARDVWRNKACALNYIAEAGPETEWPPKQRPNYKGYALKILVTIALGSAYGYFMVMWR